MKKTILISILVLSWSVIFADEIHLKNKTVLKGAIIQVTEDTVEYDPEGPSAFDTVRIDQVDKIVYDNGKVVQFRQDTIYLSNGETVKCTVTKITKDSVMYKKIDSEAENTIARDQVSQIEFSDGKVTDLSKKADQSEKGAYGKKRIGGYKDSIFRFSIFGGGGTMFNGIVDKERRVLKAYKPDLILANVIPNNYQFYPSYNQVGAEVDFMAPSINFVQKRGFDFTGIKFGVRGRYGYEFGRSTILSNDFPMDAMDSLNGRLLNYHYWGVGPTMSFIFSPRSNLYNVLLSIYGTAGQVFNGTYTAMSALRDSSPLMFRLAGQWNGVGNIPPYMSWANIYTLNGLNKTRVKGYTIRAGIGPEFSLNKYFPLIVGLHLTYAYTNLRFERSLGIYLDGDKKEAHHEVGGELSIGLHF